MDLMNPANPMNMVNPASPWYYVWNTHDDTPAQVVEASGDETALVLFLVFACFAAFAAFVWVVLSD